MSEDGRSYPDGKKKFIELYKSDAVVGHPSGLADAYAQNVMIEFSRH